MNEYIPCKRRDPTAQKAIGHVTREERERRRREQEAAKRRIEAERRETWWLLEDVAAAETTSLTREYKAVVLGEPVAQGRPRFSRQGGFVKAYDPAKSRDYKQYVRLVASEDAPEAPVTGAVVLSLKIYRAVPKSMSKRKREAALAGRLRPTTKPDVSNVLKGVEDALKGVWYADDSQIVGYGVLGKWYAERPRIEIAMQVLEA